MHFADLKHWKLIQKYFLLYSFQFDHPFFLDKLNIFNFILINVAESVKHKHAQSQQKLEHAYKN